MSFIIDKLPNNYIASSYIVVIIYRYYALSFFAHVLLVQKIYYQRKFTLVTDSTIRVRFAPAPTGMMHLGNIRTALMNYLFAQKNKGTFVLRIEDTDQQRNYDPEAHKIIEDLTWLGLTHNEGPDVGGPYGPYFQSQRDTIYQEKKQHLEQSGDIYRCFCTTEELDKKRQRQEALRIPPRYDRTCLHLNANEIQQRIESQTPFIWRVKLDHNRTIKVHDMAHGITIFELKNFSDFPITRQDGSYTFLFANFVDDLTMRITHVFRGEDHKSNTANQVALYEIFNATPPLFWHLPILCNIDGKKLSKRDFGFSLRDLKDAGFLPEAICNYLGIIGASFPEEIMSLTELAHTINLEHPAVTGQIKYDIEKLKWLNHKWINKLTPEQLTNACRPFLTKAYPTAETLTDAHLAQLLAHIQTDLTTLADVVKAVHFYFEAPTLTHADLHACISEAHRKEIAALVTQHLGTINNAQQCVDQMKQEVQQQRIPLKELFWFLRLALMGSTHGPAIHHLIEMLGAQEAQKRIEAALALLQ